MNNKHFLLDFRQLIILVACVMALVAFALSAGTGSGVAIAAVGDSATVTTGTLNVRSGPGPGYSVVTQVAQGDKLTMLGRNTDSSWIKVRLADGKTEGWVSTFYILASSPVSELPVLNEAQPWGLVITPVVNLRTGPGLSYDIITTVGQGTFVTLIGRNSNAVWTKIMVSGVEGWIGSVNLSTSVPISSLPVVDAPPVPTPAGTAVPTSAPGVTPSATATASATIVSSATPSATPTAVVPMAIVNTGELNVRSGAGPGFSIVTKVIQGDMLELLGRNTTSSWAFVKLEDGTTTGWVSTFYIVANVPLNTLPVLAESQPTGIIIAEVANLRKAPGLDADVITTIEKRTFVGVLGRNSSGEWIKISFNGTEGWVGRGVIGISVPVSSLPVVQ